MVRSFLFNSTLCASKWHDWYLHIMNWEDEMVSRSGNLKHKLVLLPSLMFPLSFHDLVNMSSFVPDSNTIYQSERSLRNVTVKPDQSKSEQWTFTGFAQRSSSMLINLPSLKSGWIHQSSKSFWDHVVSVSRWIFQCWIAFFLSHERKKKSRNYSEG